MLFLQNPLSKDTFCEENQFFTTIINTLTLNVGLNRVYEFIFIRNTHIIKPYMLYKVLYLTKQVRYRYSLAFRAYRLLQDLTCLSGQDSKMSQLLPFRLKVTVFCKCDSVQYVPMYRHFCQIYCLHLQARIVSLENDAGYSSKTSANCYQAVPKSHRRRLSAVNSATTNRSSYCFLYAIGMISSYHLTLHKFCIWNSVVK